MISKEMEGTKPSKSNHQRFLKDSCLVQFMEQCQLSLWCQSSITCADLSFGSKNVMMSCKKTFSTYFIFQVGRFSFWKSRDHLV